MPENLYENPISDELMVASFSFHKYSIHISANFFSPMLAWNRTKFVISKPEHFFGAAFSKAGHDLLYQGAHHDFI